MHEPRLRAPRLTRAIATAVALFALATVVFIPLSNDSAPAPLAPTVNGATFALEGDTEHQDHHQGASDDIARTLGVISPLGTTFEPYLWTEHGVAWSYNPANSPIDAGASATALQQAADGWSDAGGANWRFAYDGTTSAAPGTCDGRTDGVNTVGWTSDLPDGVLAYTCVIFRGKESDGTWMASEFDIEISSVTGNIAGYHYTTDPNTPSIDLASVLAHEFGHALGLPHIDSCPGSIMCAKITAGAILREPTGSDVQRVIEIYGRAETGSAGDTSTVASMHVMPSGTHVITWQGPSIDAADFAASNAGNVVVIFAWNDANGWTRYVPGAPDYVNSLQTLETGGGYVVIASGPVEVPA